jgi:chemotaxis protein MotB
MSGHPSSLGQPRRRRRVRGGHAVEEGGAERWLVTYADMLTLLLVLFIVLFSMSVVNISKFNQLKASLASAFGEGPKSVLDGGKSVLDGSDSQQGNAQIVPGAPAAPLDPENGTNSDSPSTTTPTDLTTLADKQIHNFKKIEKAVNTALDKHGMSGAVQFSMDRRGLVMTVVTNALVFDGNSATLLPDGQRILSVIAPQLVHIPNQIAVNGYTNQLPASTAPYPSGWELSSARASAVVRALIHRGINETRLSATGYNDLDPLIDPDDPKAATRNRRVDIVVMSTLPDTAGDALQSELDADNGNSTSTTASTTD